MSTKGIGPGARRMMLLAFAAGALLHADRAPLWSLGVAIAAFCWQLAHTRWRLPLPGASGAFAMLFATPRSCRSPDPG